MKSKLSFALALLLTLTLLLTGCGCKHEWKDATCTAPKTCDLCGETEGEMLAHTWVDATCETPKTCSVCNATEGDALGHKWVDATCETAKTCSVCQKTEGEKLDHKWVDATTEAPKTCTVCQKTEGEKINTDSRFKTANCKEFFGEWNGVIKVSGRDLIDPGFTGKLEVDYTITFNNDGTYKESVEVLNEKAFKDEVEQYYIATIYATFKNQYGMTKEQADKAMKDELGMDVKEFCKIEASAVDYEAIFETSAETMGKGVYYVEDGKIYSGDKWSGTLDSEGYTITETTLVLDTLKEDYPDLVLTRVTLAT